MGLCMYMNTRICAYVRVKIKNMKHQTYYSFTADHDLKIRYQQFVFNPFFIFLIKFLCRKSELGILVACIMLTNLAFFELFLHMFHVLCHML
jgi:hypothetical protein